MNPLGIFALIIGLVMGYYTFTGGNFLPFGNLPSFGSGPLASGPGRGVEIQNPQPISRGGFFGSSGAPQGHTLPTPGESPYTGKVTIVQVNRSEDRPGEEYVVLRSGGGFLGFGARANGEDRPIDVTGWRIAGIKSSVVIPQVFNIPEIDAAQSDILLPPGGEVVIVTGTPAYQQNFRENACVGYFNQSYRFTPALADSCADERPDRALLFKRGFNGACIDAIENIATCRTAQRSFAPAIVKSECIDYMNENFSYFGCVKNFRDGRDFFKNTWRVSLKRPATLFDPRHDRVTLRDQNGLIVDEFEY